MSGAPERIGGSPDEEIHPVVMNLKYIFGKLIDDIDARICNVYCDEFWKKPIAQICR